MSRVLQKFSLPVITAVVTVSVLPFVAFAQTPGNFETVQLSATPDFPTAYQNVTVTASSGTTDLSASYLTWFLNGVKQTAGVGLTSFSFKTGGFGVASEVIVSVKTQNGDTIQQGIVIRPADVNISYDALTYVPPFYKGRALYSYQSPLRVTAVPEMADDSGAKLDPASLLFSWQVNDALQQDLSGLGKNTVTLRAAIPLRETAITVTVSTLDGKETASKRVTITPAAPKIVLYQSSPLYGVLYNSALTDSKQLMEPEMTIAAVPFFFDTADPQTSMFYTWSMNGNPIGGAQNQNSITVRQTGNTAGASNVSVDAKHARDMFEYGNAGVSITFGQGVKAGAF